VIAIIPTADRQRATVEVRVGFDGLDPRILPDMGVKVAFQDVAATDDGSSGSAGVAVPRSALQQAGGRDYVFVVSDGAAERRAVAVAGERSGQVLLQSGLSPGERVIIDAPSGLADGVTVKESE
jgi:hypothetical protein